MPEWSVMMGLHLADLDGGSAHRYYTVANDVRCVCVQQVLKGYMDLFWDPLFRSLQCHNPLCEAAAAQCITSLSSFVGPRILEGHLSDDQRDVLAARGLRAQTWHVKASKRCDDCQRQGQCAC
jgi:hypothetical protein